MKKEVPAFVRRVNNKCKHKGYSVRELSRRSGISPVQLRRYMSGEREPGAAALSKLADALEVSTDWLLGRKGYPK